MRRIELRIYDSDPSIPPLVLNLRPRQGRALDLAKLAAALRDK